MMTSTALRQILKTDSLTSVATNAPKIFPTMAGMDSSTPLRRCSIPLRRKAIVAEKFCNSTAMRLVPFARPIGIPIAINSDIVITEPPPPNVLIIPTITPDTRSKTISLTLI
jgi:hypothetical protein